MLKVIVNHGRLQRLLVAFQQLSICLLLCLLVIPFSYADEMPSWVNEPAQLGVKNIIFSGTGDSYDAAQRNALTGLMAQLSSQVKSEQQIRLSNQNGRVQNSFVQNTNIKTLDLDISGIEVLEQYERVGEYAVLISVARQSLERALLDRITKQTQLGTPSHLGHKEQVLWALQNNNKIKEVQRYERTLSSLNYNTGKLRKELQEQSKLASQALLNAGIRIVHPYNMQALAATLSKQFPSSTEELFLLKVDQRSANAHRSPNQLHRIKTTISLMDAQQPFTPYLKQEIVIVGVGKTVKAAEQDAENKLLNHVKQDLSVWFFN